MYAVGPRVCGGFRRDETDGERRTTLYSEKSLTAELERAAALGVYWLPLDMQEHKCVQLVSALKRLNGL
jgi:hypothetical protein